MEDSITVEWITSEIHLSSNLSIMAASSEEVEAAELVADLAEASDLAWLLGSSREIEESVLRIHRISNVKQESRQSIGRVPCSDRLKFPPRTMFRI